MLPREGPQTVVLCWLQLIGARELSSLSSSSSWSSSSSSLSCCPGKVRRPLCWAGYISLVHTSNRHHHHLLIVVIVVMSAGKSADSSDGPVGLVVHCNYLCIIINVVIIVAVSDRKRLQTLWLGRYIVLVCLSVYHHRHHHRRRHRRHHHHHSHNCSHRPVVLLSSVEESVLITFATQWL